MSVYSKLGTFRQFKQILPLPSLLIFVLTIYSNHADPKGHYTIATAYYTT